MFIWLISTKEIQGASKCLSSIIKFLLTQETKEYYSIMINKIGDDVYNMKIYEQIINIKKDSSSGYNKIYDPRIIYFIDIVDNNVKSFNAQHAHNYSKKFKPESTSFDALKDDSELAFDYNVEHYNLFDQYNDFINFKQKTITKKNNILPINLIKNKPITIVDHENQFTINFTNCDSFNQITKYLQEQFGRGELSYEVDLRDNKTMIKYVVGWFN